MNCTDDDAKAAAKQAAIDAYAEQLDAAMANIDDMRAMDLATIESVAIDAVSRKIGKVISPDPIGEPIMEVKP